MITVEPLPAKHFFPALDFKFQNVGHASAVLWKFRLIVEHAEIDPQPVLSSRIRLEDDVDQRSVGAGRTRILSRPSRAKMLCAAIQNDGWGGALDCNLTLSNPLLDALFPLDARQVTVSIPAGATYDLRLHHASLNQEKFLKLADDSRRQARDRFETELPNLVDRAVRSERIKLRGSPVRSDVEARNAFLSTSENRRRYLEDPAIRERFRAHTMEDVFDEDRARLAAEERIRTEFDQEWKSRCSVSIDRLEIQYSLRDERNRRFSDSLVSSMGGNIGGHIDVLPDGFVHHEDFAAFCMSVPDTIYSCIIDVDRGAHVREYSISRVVPSGDAEHFQIVVGATKSSQLKIKFQFYVDKATIVESKSFFLELWNPRSAGWHREYEDGDAVREHAQGVRTRADLPWNEIHVHDKAALEAFPFQPPSRNIRR